MRIGLVIRWFPPVVRGGSQMSAYYLAKGLADHGQEVHVFTSAPSQGERGPDAVTSAHAPGDGIAAAGTAAPRRNDGDATSDWWHHPGIHRHSIFRPILPRTDWEMLASALMMGRQLRAYLERENLHLDILHAYGMDTIPAVVAARSFGRPVGTLNGHWATCPFWDHTDPSTQQVNAVCTYRHIGRCVRLRDAHRSVLRRWAKWHYLAFSLRLRQYYASRLLLMMPISASVEALLRLQRFQPPNVRRCPSVIDPDDYRDPDTTFLHRRYGIRAECRILLYAGRFAPYKGSEAILEAAPSILVRHPDAHFVFIGHGSGLASLQDGVRTLGLSASVTFGGFVQPPDMLHAYASSWAYLHTATLPEPLARGPLEAMASGTAVVATATGGTPEVVRHEDTGLLIPPFDVDALAAACVRLLDDPPLRQRLVARGREFVRTHFSLNAQIPSYLAAYESVM